jgi:serine/threonine protein kinase
MEPRPAKRAKKETASSGREKQTAQTVKDKYEFGAAVGEGAFGCVYRAAERVVNSNTVAIKVFKKGKEGEGISFSHCREIAVRRRALSPLHHFLFYILPFFSFMMSLLEVTRLVLFLRPVGF